MPELPEADARRLLERPLYNGDWTDWKPKSHQSGTVFTSAGIIDESGKRTKLYVELLVRLDAKNKTASYLFTLYRRNLYGIERVYQLSILQCEKLRMDMHSRSHWHMGSGRYLGQVEWDRWSHAEALAYFCREINLTLDPAPPPVSFPLRGKLP
jgi:hypothetical protein